MTSIPSFSNDLKGFVINNNILTTAAAMTIGFSSGTMIRSLVGDIVLPGIYRLVLSRVNLMSGAFAPINKLNVDNFLKEIVSWIFVIVLTFILIEYVIRRSILKLHPQVAQEKPISLNTYTPPSPVRQPMVVQEKKKDDNGTIAGGIIESYESKNLIYSEFVK